MKTPWLLRESKEELLRSLDIYVSECYLEELKKKVEEGRYRIKEEELPEIYKKIDEKIEKDRLTKKEEKEELFVPLIPFKTARDNYSFILGMAEEYKSFSRLKNRVTPFGEYLTKMSCTSNGNSLCVAKFNEMPRKDATGLMVNLKQFGILHIVLGDSLPTVFLVSNAFSAHFPDKEDLVSLLHVPPYPSYNLTCEIEKEILSHTETKLRPAGLGLIPTNVEVEDGVLTRTLCAAQYEKATKEDLEAIFREKLKGTEVSYIVRV